MSVETKFNALIIQLKADIRDIKADVAAVVASNGTAALGSETSAGVVELATQVEVNAGTSDEVVITPLKFQTRLAAFAQPLSANLTSLASVVSGTTGRALLGAATTAAAKTTLALVKADVGLTNVDNTADTAKPVSTAQQTALNLKADTTALPTKTSLGLANVDNTSDASKPVSTAQQTALNLKADTTALPTKTSLGLANVDNTSDVSKPVSTAQQTALNLKADTTALPTKTSLGLANVDNTSDAAKPVSTAQQTALNLKADTTALPTKTSLGLGNVDNTSDVAKPVSTAQQTALNLKANLASPGLTGVPTAPTAISGTNTTQLATTAFVASATSTALTSVPTASETVSGTVELATQVETDAGTNDIFAVTPLKFQTRLSAFAQPLNANLTTLAAVVSGVTGRSLLTAATTAAAKTTLALVKADVGLTNVDNTADTAKPVSTAQQTALNLKADQTVVDTKANRTANLVGFGQLETHATYTDFNAITDFGYHFVQGATNGPGIVGGLDQYYCVSLSLGSEYAYSQYVCQIAYKRNVAGQMAMRYREAGVWGSWVINGIAMTKSDVGLGNVDNTSDISKPVSTAQQTALNLKSNLASPTFTGTPAAPTASAGTSTTQLATTAFVSSATGAVTKTTIGLGNVDNTSDAAKPVSTSQQSALDLKLDSADTPTKISLGLGNVDNISDANKPVSTATQTALNLKANLASPGLTGIPTAPTAGAGTATTQVATTAFVSSAAGAITKTSLGLSNVDNTSDLAKPVSTAQQTALNTKAPLDSPSLTGVPTAPTVNTSTASTNQIATTNFVQAAIGDTVLGSLGVVDGGSVVAGTEALFDAGTP